MARYIIIYLVFLSMQVTAQPAHLLKSQYNDKICFVDSLSVVLLHASPESVSKLSELAKWAYDNGDNELAGELKLQQYKYQLELNYKSDEVRELTSALAVDAKEKKMYRLEADALQFMGFYCDANKKRGLALENYLAAYNLYKTFPEGTFPRRQSYIFSLYGAYYNHEDYDNAIKFLTEAANTKDTTRFDVLKTIYNSLGLCYRSLKRYDSAEWYFDKVVERARKHNDSAWIAIAMGNIGITYYYQHRYVEAIPLLQKDIGVSLSKNQIKNAAGSMYILGAIYFTQGRTDDAEQLMRRALAISESRPFWPNYMLAEQLFSGLAKVYATKGDMRLAYTYSDSALWAKDSLIALSNTVNLAKVQEKVAFVQHELETEQLNNQKKVQALIRDGLIISILFITVIAILFINRQRLRQKKLEVEKKNAEVELSGAAMQLSSFRQSIQEKNQLIEHFNQEMSKLKQGTEAEEENENEILSKLEQSIILTDEQWEQFRITFEKVHKGFFTKLKKKIPDLTQSEIRLLALTKLKLTSKEMASMLGISPNAIRLNRHRLRKKLELDKEELIEELVENI